MFEAMDAPWTALPADLISELERKYFWWEPVGGPRSVIRILAQAMDQADFADIRRLETQVGVRLLALVMRQSEPGWFSGRSWELWRGRLSLATGEAFAEEPPRRLLYAATA
jgi:hypothetical protein